MLSLLPGMKGNASPVNAAGTSRGWKTSVAFTCPEMGEIRRVVVCVAVMGTPSYTYMEACEGLDMNSRINANSWYQYQKSI